MSFKYKVVITLVLGAVPFSVIMAALMVKMGCWLPLAMLGAIGQSVVTLLLAAILSEVWNDKRK